MVVAWGTIPSQCPATIGALHHHTAGVLEDLGMPLLCPPCLINIQFRLSHVSHYNRTPLKVKYLKIVKREFYHNAHNKSWMYTNLGRLTQVGHSISCFPTYRHIFSVSSLFRKHLQHLVPGEQVPLLNLLQICYSSLLGYSGWNPTEKKLFKINVSGIVSLNAVF